MSDLETLQAEAGQFKEDFQRILEEVHKVIVGQERVVECTVTALLAGGNVLLEGVPGLGKTELVKALGQVLDLEFRRIQFTPDLMPADIIGTNIMTAGPDGAYRFEFRRGPIFTQLLLADEINRATPKTQSALLETMQEGSVTTGGVTHQLKPPFFVLATQNPIEQEGTYPLPEAQLDRFMFNLRVNYPSHADEVQILLTTTGDEAAPLEKLWTGEELLALQWAVRQVPVPETVAHYAVSLVQATRPESGTAPDFVKRYVQWGAGPRASQYLALAGKVFAVLDGRFNVAREDIQRAAKLVLRHRIITNYRAEADKQTVDTLIDRLLETVK